MVNNRLTSIGCWLPTKMTGKGLQRVTSPATERGKSMLCCFREKEEKTRAARKNLFIYESRFCLLVILMDSQISK